MGDFIARRGGDVLTLRAAIERGDFETVARLAHNMRGTAPSYGFPDLGSLGARLEAAALECRIDEARREVEELAAWVADVQRWKSTS
jgi:HPt (histidine-containing phosphotransfer) domain-containing protein